MSDVDMRSTIHVHRLQLLQYMVEIAVLVYWIGFRLDCRASLDVEVK